MASVIKPLLFTLIILSSDYLVSGVSVSWLGTAPFCNANRMEKKCKANSGWVAMHDKYGGGKKCATGLKVCCCYGYGTDPTASQETSCSTACKNKLSDVTPYMDYINDFAVSILLTALVVGSICFCFGKWYSSVNRK
eukprot:66611_1